MKDVCCGSIRAVTVVLFAAGLAGAQEAAPPRPDAVELAVKEGGGREAYQARAALAQRLSERGAPAEEAAKALLARVTGVVPEGPVRERIEGMVRDGQAPRAARLFLNILSARDAVARFKKGAVVVGHVALSDGKLDPELVLAQMEILPGGDFAGEVGDLNRPVSFRAGGYADAVVPLAGKSGPFVDLGTVTLAPLPKDQAAGLKGTVKVDGAKDVEGATVSVSLMVPPANTPHNGYSPRRRWPEATELKVDRSGAFAATGLNPGEYYLSVEAKGHAPGSNPVTLHAGKVDDVGTIRLRSTDLGFYIGSAPPKAPALAWEKDYTSALKRAGAEKKPLMVMMTATWCGPCRMLEKETLDDPWVRAFLSDFVIVKAYEDKAVEARYGLNGYPTLVFTDSKGDEASRTVGYQPTLSFAGQIVRAHEKLGHTLPAELKHLVDSKALEVKP